MAKGGTMLLSVSEMIDLAIGTPEIGVVDFNMLQNVLYCLAQQLRMLDKNVELRGSVAHLPQGSVAAKTIEINEFMVHPDATEEERKKADEANPFTPSPAEAETVLIVDRDLPTPGEGAAAAATALAKSAGKGAAAKDAAGTESGVHVSRSQGSIERLSLVTTSKFILLESVVNDLKDRVYGSMPKNEDILEEVRSQTNMNAITDMWTSLNVSSRLEAAETGINKLSSLIQDLVTELAKTGAIGPSALSALTGSEGVNESGVNEEGGGVGKSGKTSGDGEQGKEGEGLELTTTCPIGAEDVAKMKTELEKLRHDLKHLTDTFYNTIQEVRSGMDLLGVGSTTIAPDAGSGVDVAIAADLPSNTTDDTATGTGTKKPHSHSAAGATSGALLERLLALEKQVEDCCGSIGKKDDIINDQMSNFQDQIDFIMKEMSSMTNDLAAGKLSPDLIKDLHGLMELFQTVHGMQEQLQQVHNTALQLVAEKDMRQHHLNALLEQIEMLKTTKMDREDMVEAMAEKADTRLLARKVSHDQFEIACDDISRKLEHAIGKLNFQESLWQQALDDIQREIESKLDKMELSPVKDFFNNKLRQLQENLKQMASLRKEVEAAGTKKRLLRDVNCISCDAKAVMPMEATSGGSQAKSMPPTMSLKPYLCYELDTIRKQQASSVPQRNMHDWEAIDKQMSQPKTQPKVRSDVDKHLCNRYCGGSHTTTTAAQRVARLGHFIKQWGPDVVPLSSGFAAGDDGRLYKVTNEENPNAAGPGGAVDPSTCTSKPSSRKSELVRPPPGLADRTPECRCMEGDQLMKG